MYDSLVVAGLVVAAALILIPVVMITRLAYGIINGYREYRQSESRRVVSSVAGLGNFSTTDGTLWCGEVRGLEVILVSPEHAPSQLQSRQVLALLEELPALTEKARGYLADHEDMSWLDGGPASLEPCGLELESDSTFVLELTHASDPDVMYRVEFQNGRPVSSGRDD